MGTEWILVLVLKVGDHQMTSIPGFVSEKSCQETGQLWVKAAEKIRGISGGQFICLRKNNTP